MARREAREVALRRRNTLATISPVAGAVALVFVLVPPSGALVGLFLASVGFGTGWQTRRIPRGAVGVALSVVAALLLMPAIAAPLFADG